MKTMLIPFSILCWLGLSFPALSWGQGSGPMDICLDQVRIPYHSRDHLSRVHGFLGSGTVLQLPDVIRKNLKFTGHNPPRFDWKAIQKVWEALPSDHDVYAPKFRGELLYPVKVLRTSGGGLQGRHAIGYIPLKSLIRSSTHHPCGVVVREESPSMVESQRSLRPASSPSPNPSPRLSSSPSPRESSAFQDHSYFFQAGDGETTSQTPVFPELPRVGPLPSFRPTSRPARRKSPPKPKRPPKIESFPTRVMNPHKNPRCERIREQVARALGSALGPKRVRCYLDLFHKETGCRPHLSQPKGNAGNPHAAYGLCSLEASPAIRRQNRRGPECMNIRTVEQQTRCCASIMRKFSRKRSYFGPVRIGVVRKCD